MTGGIMLKTRGVPPHGTGGNHSFRAADERHAEGRESGLQRLRLARELVAEFHAHESRFPRFREAGFEWRGAGCSMCLGMNPDKLIGDQLCASSSNRNFKGRQGSPTGRTVLMSPLMVAAAAVTGEISDAREVFGLS